MLRISEVSLSDDAMALRLEGRLVGPRVAEFRTCCERVLASGQRLALDLDEVTFVEREALTLFDYLDKHGTTSINCSPFVGEQLKQIGLHCSR